MPPAAELVAFIALVALLSVGGVADVRTGRVPNRATYPAILFGLLWWPVAATFTADLTIGDALLSVLLAGLAGFLPMLLVRQLGGLGGGDVKLMAAVGAVSASPLCVLGTAFYGLIVALLMAVVIMIRRGAVRQTLRRLLGFVLMAPARVAPEADAQGPRVPFAAALAVGGLIAGIETLLRLPLPWTGL